ncbi:MAG: glycosyltransferase family 2 protein [Planctomycetaceae bacterium]
MLSVVVPVFNENESLHELHSELKSVCAEHNIDCEFIFVDDGSNDGSWQKICEITADDSRAKGIRFRRNFGKAAALTAGMRAAKGENIVMMDADLQDDPAEIPRLLAKQSEGFDVVNGWKVRRLDPWHKVYPSRVFNWMASTLTGVKLHDHNCGLKLFPKDVASEVRLYGELHRFIPILAASRGFTVTELEVNHRERQFGHSKYGVRRFMRGLLDLITVRFLTGFGNRPQHALGAVGILFFAIGCLGLTYLGGLWVAMRLFESIKVQDIGTRPLLAYSIAATLLGAQALTLGLLAELIVARTENHDTFSVSETVGDA